MSISKFNPSTTLIAITSVAVLVLAGVLVVTGPLDPATGDARPALRIIRAALFLGAMAGFAATFLMAYWELRGSRPFDGKRATLAMGVATGCLLAAWILTNTLR